MFVSIQHPGSSNATIMIDAAGNPERFNRESAIVISRKEYFGVNSPLAIKFSGFNASATGDNKVLLEWKYNTNEPQVTFEVQRMISGNAFETISTITKNPAGTLSGSHSFTDDHALPGKNYYRIRAIQQDGKEVLTNIRIVTTGSSNTLQLLSTHPNPANASFNVSLISPAAATADVKLFNASSVQVLQKNIALTAGANHFMLDIKSLPAGLYFVILNSGNETIRTRLIKQ
jgi:hypothetical protein